MKFIDDLNTMSSPIIFNSNTIELAMHNSSCWVLDLLCVNVEKSENFPNISKTFICCFHAKKKLTRWTPVEMTASKSESTSVKAAWRGKPHTCWRKQHCLCHQARVAQVVARWHAVPEIQVQTLPRANLNVHIFLSLSYIVAYIMYYKCHSRLRLCWEH